MFRFFIFSFLALTSAFADPLTEADRQALLEEIFNLKNGKAPALNNRRDEAIKVLRTAIQSDAASILLYEKCTEKLLFEKEHRRSSDFRSWKSKNKKRLNDESFQRALRHQYNWLLISLQASAMKVEDRGKLSKKAENAVLNLSKDATLIMRHRKMLSEPVLTSLVAKTYGLHRTKMENWPKSLFPISPVFEQAVLPALRKSKEFDTLKASWKLRIQCERQLAESQIFGDTETDDRKPNSAFDRFVTESQPSLIWAMYRDLYKAGDQRRSAVELLEHLQSNLTHPDAKNWLNELESMVTSPPNSQKDDTSQN